jgi:hypothetical protein
MVLKSSAEMPLEMCAAFVAEGAVTVPQAKKKAGIFRRP